MFELNLTWHMEFFNDLHWFSMTFPGKMPFFQANIKFHDFSKKILTVSQRLANGQHFPNSSSRVPNG